MVFEEGFPHGGTVSKRASHQWKPGTAAGPGVLRQTRPASRMFRQSRVAALFFPMRIQYPERSGITPATLLFALSRGRSITVFFDRTDRDAHSKFQSFRKEHPRAFVLNLRSPRDGVLHICRCDHFGDTEWQTGDDGYSPTRKVKEEVVACAKEADVVAHESCRP